MVQRLLMKELLKDIIFCKKNTFSIREKLLNPALIGTNIGFLLMSFFLYNESTFLNFILYLFLPVNLTFVLTMYVARLIQHNAVLFLPVFTLFILSFRFMDSLNGLVWISCQVLCLVLINLIGSTRCNVIMFLLIIISSAVVNNFEVFSQNISVNLLPALIIFPVLLFNSFYKTKFNIDHLNDVTKLYNKEIQLLERENNNQIATITSVVAHEINNALVILNANITKGQRLLPDSDDIFSKLERSSSRIENIVKLMKAKSFLSKDNAVFDLTKLLADDLKMLAFTVERDQIALNFNIPEATIKILGNPTEVSTVVYNLINNSKDAYQGNNFSNVAKQINVTCMQDEDRVKISFEDFAGGIPEEIQDKVFDKNFTSKQRGFGTGLGLYYVKEVINKHNGEIKLHSENGKTLFELTFSTAV
jgi:signal transduction histidine kinase